MWSLHKSLSEAEVTLWALTLHSFLVQYFIPALGNNNVFLSSGECQAACCVSHSTPVPLLFGNGMGVRQWKGWVGNLSWPFLPFFLPDWSLSDPEAWEYCTENCRYVWVKPDCSRWIKDYHAWINLSLPLILSPFPPFLLFFFPSFFLLHMGYYVLTSVMFTSVSQQRCLFL